VTTEHDAGSAVTATTGRRVEVHGRVVRADGRVEELGLLAGREADGTPMVPDPRPTGVEHAAAVAWVTAVLLRWVERFGGRYNGHQTATRIVDDLFRYGPIVPDGTPGARTHLTPQEDA
jgi:hypothetical protein